jgi:ABC-type multidrug transport system fused ATPase/permease subunit
LYNRFGDVLEVLPHTLAVGATGEELQQQHTLISEHMARVQAVYSHMTNIQMVTVTTSILAVGSVFGLLWYAFRKGNMTAAALTSALFVLMCSRGVVWRLVTGVNPFLKEYAHITRLNDYFERLDAESHETHAFERDAITHIPTCTSPNVEFERVSFSYGSQSVLNNISFTLPANSKTLIQGPVGSGKSTMGLLMLGLQQATSGTIRLCNHDINTLSRKGISHLVSMVPAVPALLDRTVRENLLFGLRDRRFTDTEMLAALRLVNLNLPLNRNVGHRGEELSTGQRKLLYLAKTYLQNTPIIFVDEPIANLDPDTVGLVIQSLNTISNGKILVMVSHETPANFQFDRVLHMNNGMLE